MVAEERSRTCSSPPPPRPCAGKVADVQRQTTRGFARGRLLLEGGGAHAGTRLLIDFQNENLVAAEQPSGRVLAAVPDLICCVEAQSESGGCRSFVSSAADCAVHPLLLMRIPASPRSPACPTCCQDECFCSLLAALLRRATRRHRGAAVRAAAGGTGAAGPSVAHDARGAGGGGPRRVWA